MDMNMYIHGHGLIRMFEMFLNHFLRQHCLCMLALRWHSGKTALRLGVGSTVPDAL